MDGLVLLGGGGDAVAEREVWSRFLSRPGRILYWPFALDEARVTTASLWFASQLRILSGDERDFDTWTSLDGHEPSELEDYAVLCVGGGNTFALLDHVQRHRFLPVIRNWVHRGGAYYGGSAGALLATSCIAVAEVEDRNDVGLVDFEGLDLLHTRGLLPHFDSTKIDRAHWWNVQFATPILGLPESSGLLVDDTGVEVLGPAPATLVSNGTVTTYPAHSRIPQHALSQPSCHLGNDETTNARQSGQR